MLRGLFWTAAMTALTAAALLVPFEGRSLWDRASDRGIPQAVARESDRAIAWMKSFRKDKEEPKRPAAAARVPPARVKKAKPAEKLTGRDRADLERLIQRSR